MTSSSYSTNYEPAIIRHEQKSIVQLGNVGEYRSTAKPLGGCADSIELLPLGLRACFKREMLAVALKLPMIRGVIERRILVNYRVDPEVLLSLLPQPFRPKLHRGHGMVGICLIRLSGIRPAFVPSWLGISSENAAHRVAVEWDEEGRTHDGVYIRRRDTNSRLNALAGGRLFPGYHYHARFEVHETDTHFAVALSSDDGVTKLSVVGDVVEHLPTTSSFASIAEASHFFESPVGYSATQDPERFQGLELRCNSWQVTPLELSDVHSSYFDNTSIFPARSIEFDCALLMRNIQLEWHGKSDLCCSAHTPSEWPAVALDSRI